jgi:S1-C subfamily serine protease
MLQCCPSDSIFTLRIVSFGNYVIWPLDTASTVISKVIPGSRADKAGVKLGDEFLWRGDPAN